jgi:hypothetical protein
MFDTSENDRRYLEERGISVIDLGSSSEPGAMELLRSFLANMVEQLNSFPYIPAELHEGAEAKSRVPIDATRRLANVGYELICSVEYRVYCAYLDAGQFTSTPHNWKPPVPREYDTPEHERVFYCRSEPPHDPEFIWHGWAIGKRR